MKTVALTLVLCASVAHADDTGSLELGAALGDHAFSGNGEPGVDDLMSEPGPVSSIAVDARVAYLVLPRLAVEGEALAIPTKDDDVGDSALALGLRAHARFDVLLGRVVAFVLGGIGMHLLRPSSPQMASDADQAIITGAPACARR